ncbi:TetR/AcrR family transcriptional regulator [Halalkalibacter oceani]|uniref:TetR/AcrR family transcriptional regulator n=1 Tax=Halalkalibacter oceani TaxID=1653776 RepID=A0A9X2IMN5_9BACI|nr:TetR/AcrR family transcriptional regulator [Halalkalibacter oceani]MCM3712941.1 TetR/AcrR family transcriptional regulator [Halalkalibacter oceani]
MAPRRKAEDELTKAQILDAAKKLFAEKGYHQVSMRSMARELGCSHGAIYYHFSNKAAVFTAFIESGFQLLNARLTAVMEETSLTKEEKLIELFRRFLTFGIEYPHHYEAMFHLKDDELRHTVHASYESFQLFGEAIQHLAVKQISQRDAWSSLFALHGFVTFFQRRGQTVQELKVMIDHHAQFLADSLT